MENNCVNFFKSIHNRRSYGPDKFGRTYKRTQIHKTEIVTTMSRLLQAGSPKKRPLALELCTITQQYRQHTTDPA